MHLFRLFAVCFVFFSSGAYSENETRSELVLIHGSKPLKVAALTAAFGSKIKTGTFWCPNPERAKFMGKQELKCETYFVDDVWMSNIHFDRASYSQDTNGILRELTVSKHGKCEAVLKTYFDLSRYIYHGLGQSIAAKVTDQDVSYEVPVSTSSNLRSNSVSLSFVDSACRLTYDFARSSD